MHIASMFANSYLYAGYIALSHLERFGFQSLFDCGSNYRWFSPYHKPEPNAQKDCFQVEDPDNLKETN